VRGRKSVDGRKNSALVLCSSRPVGFLVSLTVAVVSYAQSYYGLFACLESGRSRLSSLFALEYSRVS
jgi:hypothetical protein